MQGSGDNDLRRSGPNQPGVYQPWLQLRREGDQTPPRIPHTIQHTEFVEEQGLVGFRIIAKIIDFFVWSIASSVVIGPVYIIWFFANISTFNTARVERETGPISGDSFIIVWGLTIFLMFLASVLYYFFSEYKFQQTVGKKVFDLKVVSESGHKASARQLLARAVLYTLSVVIYFWIIELVVVVLGVNSRSVTDRVTGTKVVRARKVYHYPPSETS